MGEDWTLMTRIADGVDPRITRITRIARMGRDGSWELEAGRWGNRGQHDFAPDEVKGVSDKDGKEQGVFQYLRFVPFHVFCSSKSQKRRGWNATRRGGPRCRG